MYPMRSGPCARYRARRKVEVGARKGARRGDQVHRSRGRGPDGLRHRAGRRPGRTARVVVRSDEALARGAKERIDRALASQVKKGKLEDSVRDRGSRAHRTDRAATTRSPTPTSPSRPPPKTSRSSATSSGAPKRCSGRTRSWPPTPRRSRSPSSPPPPAPRHVIGMHFMNPPPLMRLVEIIRALQTTDETTEREHAVTSAWAR